MDTPIIRPTTDSSIDWEHYRIRRIMAIMGEGFPNGGGLTPNQAASSVDPLIAAEFRRSFPSSAFPLEIDEAGRSSSAASLPGGIKTGEDAYWVLSALPRPADGVTRIHDATLEHFQLLAALYKPSWRTAVVLRPDGSGPVHTEGQYSPVIPGEISAVQFDGWGLWCLCEERFKGDFEFYASLGAKERSVSYWFDVPEIGGPYLRHLALVSGERPGIPNMPNLDEFFAQRDGDEAMAATSGCEIRTFTSIANPLTGSTTMDTPNPDVTPTPDPAEQTPAPSFRERVIAALTGSDPAQPANPTPAQPVAPTEPAAPAAPTVDAAAIAEALVPAFTEAVGDLVTPLREELETTRAELAANARAARDSEVNAHLDRLVQDQRLAPAMLEAERKLMTGEACSWTDEQVTARITALSAAPRLFTTPSTTVEVTEGEGEDRVTTSLELPRHLRSPEGAVQLSCDAADARIEAEARQATRNITDPAERQRAYVAHIWAASGHNGANAGFLQ